MPYVAPRGHGIIPRKKVTKPRERRSSAIAPNAASHGASAPATDHVTNDLSNQLTSTHIDSTPTLSKDPGGLMIDTRFATNRSNRSSIDSQSHSQSQRSATSTRSSHPASFVSIPSLIGGSTEGGESSTDLRVTSPQRANLIMSDDAPRRGSGDKELNRTTTIVEEGGEIVPLDERRHSTSASTASSPYGQSAPSSGIVTPLTSNTSLVDEDEGARSLMSYKQGLYAYTRDLYLAAQEKQRRKEARQSFPQFGLNSTAIEQTKAKKARARRLSSFD